MSLNKTNLALVLTIALGSTAAEVDAAFDEAREVLGFSANDSISPADIAAASQHGGMAALTGQVERDSAGLPWDQRIHSSSKEKNADGSWRARRNVDATTRAKVEAELKATIAAPVNIINTAPPIPAPPALPPLPVAPPANPVFTNFVGFLAQHTRSETNPTGRLTDEWVKQCLAANGVAGGELQNLAANPALIPQIEAGIKAALGLVA